MNQIITIDGESYEVDRTVAGHIDEMQDEIETLRKPPRCRHNKMWVIAGGYWYWCYECGAIRQAQRSLEVNGSYPIGPWIKPVGKGGENPYKCKPDTATASAHQLQRLS